ncbi:MAG: FAD-binding oxidoreductase [Ottowia sp.]|nr:FAD-binding oxidoreductase [Ottowia sp.]
MDTADVLIVGAGMAGASLAWHLAQDDVDVVVLERESQAGYHSTGRSAAMFMESYGPPGVRALTRAGRAFYLAPPAGFAPMPLLHERQALYVATAGQRQMLDARGQELAASGTVLDELDAAALARRVPVLRTDVVRHGLLDRNAYDIDVDALLQGYLRGARQAGARILMNTELLAARAAGAGGWTVTLAGDRNIHARRVVDAAGAWADAVAEVFGVQRIGMQPKRRSAFIFPPPDGMECAGWPMVSDIGERWYFKPDAGQLLGSPANVDPVPPQDVQPEDLDIALAIDHIQNATTMQIRRPTATWAGLRNFVADGDIVIGRDPDHADFFWLAAQGGYGIQSAPGASLLASCLLQGKALPPELSRFGVDPAAVSPARLR